MLSQVLKKSLTIVCVLLFFITLTAFSAPILHVHDIAATCATIDINMCHLQFTLDSKLPSIQQTASISFPTTFPITAEVKSLSGQCTLSNRILTIRSARNINASTAASSDELNANIRCVISFDPLSFIIVPEFSISPSLNGNIPLTIPSMVYTPTPVSFEVPGDSKCGDKDSSNVCVGTIANISPILLPLTIQTTHSLVTVPTSTSAPVTLITTAEPTATCPFIISKGTPVDGINTYTISSPATGEYTGTTSCQIAMLKSTATHFMIGQQSLDGTNFMPLFDASSMIQYLDMFFSLNHDCYDHTDSRCTLIYEFPVTMAPFLQNPDKPQTLSIFTQYYNDMLGGRQFDNFDPQLSWLSPITTDSSNLWDCTAQFITTPHTLSNPTKSFIRFCAIYRKSLQTITTPSAIAKKIVPLNNGQYNQYPQTWKIRFTHPFLRHSEFSVKFFSNSLDVNTATRYIPFYYTNINNNHISQDPNVITTFAFNILKYTTPLEIIWHADVCEDITTPVCPVIFKSKHIGSKLTFFLNTDLMPSFLRTLDSIECNSESLILNTDGTINVVNKANLNIVPTQECKLTYTVQFATSFVYNSEINLSFTRETWTNSRIENVDMYIAREIAAQAAAGQDITISRLITINLPASFNYRFLLGESIPVSDQFTVTPTHLYLKTYLEEDAIISRFTPVVTATALHPLSHWPLLKTTVTFDVTDPYGASQVLAILPLQPAYLKLPITTVLSDASCGDSESPWCSIDLVLDPQASLSDLNFPRRFTLYVDGIDPYETHIDKQISLTMQNTMTDTYYIITEYQTSATISANTGVIPTPHPSRTLPLIDSKEYFIHDTELMDLVYIDTHDFYTVLHCEIAPIHGTTSYATTINPTLPQSLRFRYKKKVQYNDTIIYPAARPWLISYGGNIYVRSQLFLQPLIPTFASIYNPSYIIEFDSYLCQDTKVHGCMLNFHRKIPLDEWVYFTLSPTLAPMFTGFVGFTVERQLQLEYTWRVKMLVSHGTLTPMFFNVWVGTTNLALSMNILTYETSPLKLDITHDISPTTPITKIDRSTTVISFTYLPYPKLGEDCSSFSHNQCTGTISLPRSFIRWEFGSASYQPFILLQYQIAPVELFYLDPTVLGDITSPNWSYSPLVTCTGMDYADIRVEFSYFNKNPKGTILALFTANIIPLPETRFVYALTDPFIPAQCSFTFNKNSHTLRYPFRSLPINIFNQPVQSSTTPVVMPNTVGYEPMKWETMDDCSSSTAFTRWECTMRVTLSGTSHYPLTNFARFFPQGRPANILFPNSVQLLVTDVNAIKTNKYPNPLAKDIFENDDVCGRGLPLFVLLQDPSLATLNITGHLPYYQGTSYYLEVSPKFASKRSTCYTWFNFNKALVNFQHLLIARKQSPFDVPRLPYDNTTSAIITHSFHHSPDVSMPYLDGNVLFDPESGVVPIVTSLLNNMAMGALNAKWVAFLHREEEVSIPDSIAPGVYKLPSNYPTVHFDNWICGPVLRVFTPKKRYFMSMDENAYIALANADLYADAQAGTPNTSIYHTFGPASYQTHLAALKILRGTTDNSRLTQIDEGSYHLVQYTFLNHITSLKIDFDLGTFDGLSLPCIDTGVLETNIVQSDVHRNPPLTPFEYFSASAAFAVDPVQFNPATRRDRFSFSYGNTTYNVVAHIKMQTNSITKVKEANFVFNDKYFNSRNNATWDAKYQDLWTTKFAQCWLYLPSSTFYPTKFHNVKHSVELILPSNMTYFGHSHEYVQSHQFFSYNQYTNSATTSKEATQITAEEQLANIYAIAAAHPFAFLIKDDISYISHLLPNILDDDAISGNDLQQPEMYDYTEEGNDRSSPAYQYSYAAIIELHDITHTPLDHSLAINASSFPVLLTLSVLIFVVVLF